MAIAVDMPRVFALVAECQHYPDTLGYGERFEQIVRAWRLIVTVGEEAETI